MSVSKEPIKKKSSIIGKSRIINGRLIKEKL